MSIIPACSLVTACYDLTAYNSCNRTAEELTDKMKELLKVPVYLIIFTESKCLEKIKALRGNLYSLTHYVVKEFSELTYYHLVDKIKANREKYHPTKDSRTCAESHLLCCSKFDFVKQAMEINPFQTEKFGWTDCNVGERFGKICRNYRNNTLPYILSHITDKFQITVLNVADKKFLIKENLREYYSCYQWVVCGGFFTTSKTIGLPIINRLIEIFVETTELGYGHGEEMFYLPILEEFQDSIYPSYGDYQDIIDNFVNQRESFWYVERNIIKKYRDFGYFKEGIRCCEKVLSPIENYEVDVAPEVYIGILLHYYHLMFGFDKIKAATIKERIIRIYQTNPIFRKEFIRERGFIEKYFPD